jgi:hypothetical protein
VVERFSISVFFRHLYIYNRKKIKHIYMNCLNFNINEININENYILPFLGLFGLCITYLGNKFIRPTLFLSGILLSTTSSYKLTEFILNETKQNSCEILYASTLISGISGGFLILKLYSLSNFFLGICSGGSIGYLVYISGLNNICLGTYFIYDNMLWICIGIPGIISGIITYIYKKELSIILTSLIGPCLLIYSGKILIELKFNNSILLSILYILLYLILSSTGYYIQNKRLNNNNDKEISYKPHYKCINYN